MSIEGWVVPLVGTWIEIYISIVHLLAQVSFPLWERGLKSPRQEGQPAAAGSFPLWERGLKYGGICTGRRFSGVVPLVGTWIEMTNETKSVRKGRRRSPCGNVD